MRKIGRTGLGGKGGDDPGAVIRSYDDLAMVQVRD